MIVPGAVFEIPADFADPPQRRYQTNPPARESRWVLIVSCKGDRRDRGLPTVLTVLCSAQVDYQDRPDVLIRCPDGGLQRDSIAQTDLVFVVPRVELTDGRYRGTVFRDTLGQVRAKLSERLGFTERPPIAR